VYVTIAVLLAAPGNAPTVKTLAILPFGKVTVAVTF
jgi:hypothetical protein